MRRVAVVFGIVLTVVACRGTADPTTSTGMPTTPVAPTSVVPTTSEAPSTTTTSPFLPTSEPPADLTVVLPIEPLSEMDSDWDELVFAYGDSPELLGTSPGGDGLMFGPEYGTQTADGRWWFMDAAKGRIAVYDQSGSYLEEVVLPPDVLVDGVYFQYQIPKALDDGSLAVGGFREDATDLLRLVDMVPSVVTVPGITAWTNTDGVDLYGLDMEGLYRKLDLATLEVDATDYLLTRAGTRYSVRRVEGALEIDLPDAGLTRRLELRFSEDPDVVVEGGLQVDTGADGSVFILILGVPRSDESLGVGALITVAHDGEVTSEPIADPFSPADPGSPANLGVTPLTSEVWFMTVWENGVHVFTRR